ncbi:MAG: tRNA (guanosine(37)-N1)-methyltransferase TrmD, partial [Clostridia bacterium]|nr:tRNA (guanosine(37)-N1)-methyltransferase TrmD [Clostridia bacterium]
RPFEWHGKAVPDILISGHHEKISRYRREESLKRTYLRRPELLSKAELSKKDIAFLSDFKKSLKESE